MTGTGFTRRQALLAGAALVLGAGTGPGTARATNGWQAALSAFTDGLQPVASGITLDLPEIAENGNMVPMTIRVESPMTPDDHVAEVIVIATDNPEPEVTRFRFTPLAGRAEVVTRIRLARSQEVIAAARMADGSTRIDRRQVSVIVGGCGA